MAEPLQRVIQGPGAELLPKWADPWLPVVILLAMIPATKFALIIISRIWLVAAERVRDKARAKQRIRTIIAFVRSVLYSLLLLMALMQALRAVFPGFDPATATGALSIVALLLTGMYRDVVVDVVKGLDILFGQHYAVGDYIRVGNFSGYVIDFQLKYTKLRSASGEEIVINNAACIPSRRFPGGAVLNFVDIPLARPADEPRAKQVIDEVSNSLIELVEQVRDKPAFQAAFPSVAGSLVLRYSAHLLPGADWAIGERFVPMVRSALAAADIPLACEPSHFFMNDIEQFRSLFERPRRSTDSDPSRSHGTAAAIS